MIYWIVVVAMFSFKAVAEFATRGVTDRGWIHIGIVMLAVLGIHIFKELSRLEEKFEKMLDNKQDKTYSIDEACDKAMNELRNHD